MMNKTVEAIKNGQEVAREELFELINAYNLTNLEVYSNDDEMRLAGRQEQQAHCSPYMHVHVPMHKTDCLGLMLYIIKVTLVCLKDMHICP